MLRRDAEEMKNEASKVKQTTMLNNTAHSTPNMYVCTYVQVYASTIKNVHVQKHF